MAENDKKHSVISSAEALEEILSRKHTNGELQTAAEEYLFKLDLDFSLQKASKKDVDKARAILTTILKKRKSKLVGGVRENLRKAVTMLNKAIEQKEEGEENTIALGTEEIDKKRAVLKIAAKIKENPLLKSIFSEKFEDKLEAVNKLGEQKGFPFKFRFESLASLEETVKTVLKDHFKKEEMPDDPLDLEAISEWMAGTLKNVDELDEFAEALDSQLLGYKEPLATPAEKKPVPSPKPKKDEKPKDKVAEPPATPLAERLEPLEEEGPERTPTITYSQKSHELREKAKLIVEESGKKEAPPPTEEESADAAADVQPAEEAPPVEAEPETEKPSYASPEVLIEEEEPEEEKTSPEAPEKPTLQNLENEFQKDPKLEFIIHVLMGNVEAIKPEGLDITQEQLLEVIKKRSCLDAFHGFAEDRQSAMQILLDQEEGANPFTPDQLDGLSCLLRGTIHESIQKKERESIEPEEFDDTKIVREFQSPEVPSEEAVESKPDPFSSPSPFSVPPPFPIEEGEKNDRKKKAVPMPTEEATPTPETVEEDEEKSKKEPKELIKDLGLDSDMHKVVKPLLEICEIDLSTIEDEYKRDRLEGIQKRIQHIFGFHFKIEELRKLQETKSYKEAKKQLQSIKEDLELLWADVQKVLQEELLDVLPAEMKKTFEKKTEEAEEPEKKAEEEVDIETLANKMINSKKPEVASACKTIGYYYNLILSDEEFIPVPHSLLKGRGYANIQKPAKGKNYLIPRELILEAMQNKIHDTLKKIFSEPERDLKAIISIILEKDPIEADRWKKKEKHDEQEQKIMNAKKKLLNGIAYHSNEYLQAHAQEEELNTRNQLVNFLKSFDEKSDEYGTLKLLAVLGADESKMEEIWAKYPKFKVALKKFAENKTPAEDIVDFWLNTPEAKQAKTLEEKKEGLKKLVEQIGNKLFDVLAPKEPEQSPDPVHKQKAETDDPVLEKAMDYISKRSQISGSTVADVITILKQLNELEYDELEERLKNYPVAIDILSEINEGNSVEDALAHTWVNHYGKKGTDKSEDINKMLEWVGRICAETFSVEHPSFFKNTAF